MSDIFITAGHKVDATDIARRLSWTPETKAWSGQSGGLTWIATRVDDPVLWAPAFDPSSGIRVLVGGRLAFEEVEWQAGDKLAFEGGLACRIVIDRWHKGGASAIEKLNGGAQIIVIDERKRELHVWTDRMGFYPAFGWTNDGFMLCSHPDVLAAALEAAGQRREFDPVTMAEFLRTGTSTHPNTYWRGIRHLDAGTRFKLDFGTNPRLCDTQCYWRPAYMEDRPYLTDRREIVERLADALRSAVRRRTLPRLGKVAVLLSAGADSRTALFGACDPSAVTCFTFFDETNPELANAQQLAAAVGASHVGYQRSRDYYFEHAPRSVQISGGMWSADSAHYGGLLRRLSGREFGAVITGCYTDYMLKGLAYNRRQRTVFGRSLPIYVRTEFNHEFYQPFASLTHSWMEQVGNRLDRRYGDLRGVDPVVSSQAEHMRLVPIVREADASGRLLLRHTTAFDLFTADNAIVDLAGAIHPDCKVSGIEFGMAVARITGDRGKHITNNNYNSPVGATERQRVAAFVLASLKRKLTGQGGGQPYQHDPESIATVGSWPYFPRVIQMSERAHAWRADLPRDQEEILFGMLGEERRLWTIDEWAERDATLFLRLYTASLWLSQQPHALGGAQGNENAT